MQYRRNKIQNLKHGDTEERVKFAWRTVNIGDIAVWLGRYKALYMWVVAKYQANGNEYTVGKWVQISRATLK